MNRLKDLDILLIILAIALVIGGFFLFRVLLIGEGIPPYSKEIAAILLGTLLTILITGIMLHKQTEVELNKERNVKLLEAKMKAYDELLTAIEDILSSGDKIDLRREVIRIQILNQKISFVASVKVLEKVSGFAKVFMRVFEDNKIDDEEMSSLLKATGELAVEIRRDLASEEERKHFPEKLFTDLITANTKELSRGKDRFLSMCNDADKTYFKTLFDHLEKNNKLGLDWGTTGFAIKKVKTKDRDSISICRAWPTSAKRGIQVVLEHAPADKKANVVALLGKYGIGFEESKKQVVIPLTPKIPVDELCSVVNLLASE